MRWAPMRQAPSCAVRSPSRSVGVRTLVRMSRENLRVHFAGMHEFDGGDADAFLGDFATRAHGAGIHAADVGVMGTIGNVECGMCATGKERQARPWLCRADGSRRDRDR